MKNFIKTLRISEWASFILGCVIVVSYRFVGNINFIYFALALYAVAFLIMSVLEVLNYNALKRITYDNFVCVYSQVLDNKTEAEKRKMFAQFIKKSKIINIIRICFALTFAGIAIAVMVVF